jgi:hypothetical protein
MKQQRQHVTKRQLGIVVSYVLYGIALMAVVGAAYARLSTSQQQGLTVQNTVDEVARQLELIKSKVILCGAIYGDGDHGAFNARHPYPVVDASGDYQDVLSNVSCPASGSPVALSALSDGVPLPVSPPDFDEWEYRHTLGGGIRLVLRPRVSDGAPTARNRLLRRYSGSAVAVGDTIEFVVLN